MIIIGFKSKKEVVSAIIEAFSEVVSDKKCLLIRKETTKDNKTVYWMQVDISIANNFLKTLLELTDSDYNEEKGFEIDRFVFGNVSLKLIDKLNDEYKTALLTGLEKSDFCLIGD